MRAKSRRAVGRRATGLIGLLAADHRKDTWAEACGASAWPLDGGSGCRLGGQGRAKGPALATWCFPTTAGTGSEVTPVSILTVGQRRKRGVVVACDPCLTWHSGASLTVGLPAPITSGNGGLDAMVHLRLIPMRRCNANNQPRVPSWLGPRSLCVSLGDLISKPVVADGQQCSTPGGAHRSMFARSMLGGLAPLANSRWSRPVHALAYPSDGTFHNPHAALSNALDACLMGTALYTRHTPAASLRRDRSRCLSPPGRGGG